MSLFLVPATRENLEQSIEKSVSLDVAIKSLGQDFVNEILRHSGNEGIRCWAVTKNSKKFFTDISLGDEVLLTEKGTGLFTHYGIVVGKVHNINFGKELWPIVGKNPWEYIYFLANIQHINISKKELVVKLGYQETYTVSGSIKAKNDNYGSIGTISKNYEIPVFDHIAESNEDKDYSAINIQSSGSRRQGHQKFSKVVKENYGHQCAVCGITETEFLIAGHISTWAEDEKNRLNPSNGICLCSLHDKAFEHGFISINNKYQIVVNSNTNKKSILFKELEKFHKKTIKLPKKNNPDIQLLLKHQKKHNF